MWAEQRGSCMDHGRNVFNRAFVQVTGADTVDRRERKEEEYGHCGSKEYNTIKYWHNDIGDKIISSRKNQNSTNVHVLYTSCHDTNNYT